MWTINLVILLSTIMIRHNDVQMFNLENPSAELTVKSGKLDRSVNPVEWVLTKRVSENVVTTILEIEKPRIYTAAYAIQGEISYEVSGSGFLELNHLYGEKGTFYTRALSPKGPMGLIKGSSSWRPFILPFYRNSKGSLKTIELPPPEKLLLNLNLKGKGTVKLRSISLVNLKKHPDMSLAQNQWWTKRQSGLFFGSLGAVIGIIYALMGFFAGRGKFHKEVCHLLLGMGIFGFLLLLGAFTGAVLGQPVHVIWPFFLTGSLMVAFLLFFRPRLWANYHRAELLKMEARDIP